MNFTSSNKPSIDFSFNQLKGSIPLWSGVSALYLKNNLLSGTIPTNIGKEMSQLRYLDLTVFNFTRLTSITFHDNLLKESGA
jgi:hypothetical protein